VPSGAHLFLMVLSPTLGDVLQGDHL